MNNTRELLLRLGYHEDSIESIMNELNALLQEIDFETIEKAIITASDAKDKEGVISSLKNLMLLLENKGCYRPDAPTRLIRLLANGLCLKKEDIFALIDKANISKEEKRKEKEFLASCAPITQLGYILLSPLFEIKAANSGPHVFLISESFSDYLFIDLSIDSILEIELDKVYSKSESYYSLENVSESDREKAELLKKYYSFIHVTSGTGMSACIHNNLGIACDKIRKYEEAVEELQEALRLEPGYIEAHNNLAVTFEKTGRIEEAIKELQHALMLNPGYVEALCNLGNIHAKHGRYEDAIGELQKALRINPDHAFAHNSLGSIYAWQKRYDEAIEEFKAAIRLNPDYASAHCNLGEIFIELGKNEEALKEFQEALRLEPEFPDAHFGTGLALYNTGSHDRAARAFISACFLDSELLDLVPEKLSLKVKQGIKRMS